MTALDNLDERTSAIDEKFQGSRQKSNDAAISRESMRQGMGSELIRGLVLK